MIKQCKRCKTVNPLLNRFCIECGSYLEPHPPPVSISTNSTKKTRDAKPRQTKRSSGLGNLVKVIVLTVVLPGAIVLVVVLNASNNSNKAAANARIEQYTANAYTAQAQTTATIVAIQATATVGTLDNRARIVFGPVNGTLRHFIDIKSSSVNLRNFLIDVNFSNPYDATEHAWDYGFLFRDTGSNNQYRLGVTSNKYWFFDIADGTPPNQHLLIGHLENLNTSANESNRLVLYVSEDKGFFYVNNIFIVTLDLSKNIAAGDISVGTGITGSDQVNGKETRYQNFTVYSLP